MIKTGSQYVGTVDDARVRPGQEHRFGEAADWVIATLLIHPGDICFVDPKLLAGGISEALVTTQTGLIIAIPIILLHNYLSGKMNHIVNEVSASSMALLNQIWPEEETRRKVS